MPSKKKVGVAAPAGIRNRIRGVVGAAKSKRFRLANEGGTDQQKALDARIKLRRIYADARKVLGDAEYADLVRWSSQYVQAQAPIIDQKPRFEELGFFPLKPAMSLEEEIGSTCAYLALNTEAIGVFRIDAESLEEAFWKDDRARTNSLLDQIEDTFGETLWLVEARIAFKQAHDGLEVQKLFAKDVRRKSKGRLAGYFAFYMSVKNEPTVTPTRFSEDIATRLANSPKIPESGRVYLNLRLGDNWPSTKSGLARILQVEQTTSVIDLYETFIRVAQRLVSDEVEPSVALSLSAGLKKLEATGDYRVTKLLLLLNPLDPRGQQVPSTNATDLLLRGSLRKSLSLALRQRKTGQININDVLTVAMVLAQGDLKIRINTRLRDVFFKFGTIYSRVGDFDRVVIDTLRLTRNFSFLPSVKALRQVCELEGFPRGSDISRKLRLKLLNGRDLDPRDFCSTFDIVEPGLLKALIHGRMGEVATLLSVLGNFDSAQRVVTLDPCLREAIVAIGELNTPRTRKTAISKLQKLALSDTLPRSIRLPTLLICVEQLIEIGELAHAVDLIAHEFAVVPAIQRVLPIARAVGEDGWRSLSPYSDRISVPILLDLRSRDSSDDTFATHRRFAVQVFLKRQGVDRPSELTANAARFGKPELIYFLDKICVSSVLDMLSAFVTSEELNEERKRICASLIELDPANSEQYQDEILELTNRAILRSGLAILDSSRVHVEADGILKWAKRELEESYFRYLDLVAAGLGASEDLHEILRRIRQEGDSPYLELPTNEADEILLRLVSSIQERFLFDASYGLDSYLSQRIRHGSIQNYLRGPVERERLVTQKNASGEYEVNDHWLDRLMTCTGTKRDQVSNAFEAFARAYDETILELKDKYLQVRSKEKPEGLFAMDRLTVPIYYIIRSTAQSDKSFDNFVHNCIAVFWVVLGPSLEDAKSFLTGPMKKRFVLAFEKLRSQLVSLVDDDPGFAALSNTIGDTTAKVQSELDRIAGWLDRRESQSAQIRYTIAQAFEIAVASAVSGHKAFDPQIMLLTAADLTVSTPELIAIADIVRVALGNVHEHAKLRRGPKVRIDVTTDDDATRLFIKIKSEIAPSARNPDAEQRLANIREDIANGSVSEKVRTEGGSGLYKIASLLGPVARENLAFDFEGTKHFVLNVILPLLEVKEAG